mmetsp:Transcript_894/g.2524  ORF Transcript_894/g.2524 Transcript_894/m.2524 type:complete len:82 (-) Transcript_894:444-689(-)
MGQWETADSWVARRPRKKKSPKFSSPLPISAEEQDRDSFWLGEVLDDDDAVADSRTDVKAALRRSTSRDFLAQPLIFGLEV